MKGNTNRLTEAVDADNRDDGSHQLDVLCVGQAVRQGPLVPRPDAVALRQRTDDWFVPRLWRCEFRNVLARYLRARIIGQDQAKALIRGAEAELVDFEREVDSTEVMDLVAVSTCSAYDCEYVALARSTGNSLVTEDARIVRDFPDVAVTLATVLSGS